MIAQYPEQAVNPRWKMEQQDMAAIKELNDAIDKFIK